VHVALIAALLEYAPVRRALATAKPIMVSIITAPAPLAERPPSPRPRSGENRSHRGGGAVPPKSAAALLRRRRVASSFFGHVARRGAAAAAAPRSVRAEPRPSFHRASTRTICRIRRRVSAARATMHEQGKVLIRVLVSVDGPRTNRAQDVERLRETRPGGARNDPQLDVRAGAPRQREGRGVGRRARHVQPGRLKTRGAAASPVR
jgi:hypothetical protein